MVLEARPGRKGLILVSRERPARSQGDRGVREFWMAMLGSGNEVSVMG